MKVGPGVPNPWNPTLDYVQDWIWKSQPTGETKPQPMRDDAMLEGHNYTKPPASRFITHGSQANASTIPVICCMPSPASCQEAVHKGHFHTGIDLSSQYEQLWASSTTSLVHTIGFNNIQYAPLSAPQGSHHSPVQGQNFSNLALTVVDNCLILQPLCLPNKYTQGLDLQTIFKKPPPTLTTTKQSYDDIAHPTPMVKLLRD